jgi:dihydrofolate reductase
MGGHDRPLRRRRGGHRRAESQAGRGAAGARQRQLVRSLLDNQLVDEITLLVYPVVVGQGTRLFPDTGPDAALDLMYSRSTPSGLSIQVYRPTGRPQYATATAD